MTIVVGRCAGEFHESSLLMDATKFLPGSNTDSNPSTFSLCVGCGSAIYDPFILHVQPDLEWHGRCLKCFKCHRSLGNDATCFVRDGKAYCREDYLNTFCYRCAGCQQIVSQSDLVFRIRSRAFHLECFRCAVCEKLLQPGAEIALQDDQICCLTHASGLVRSVSRPLVHSTAPHSITTRLFTGAEAEDALLKSGGEFGLRRLKRASSPDRILANDPSDISKITLPQPAIQATQQHQTDNVLDIVDEYGLYEDLPFGTDRKRKASSVDRGSLGRSTIVSKTIDTDLHESFANSPSAGTHSCSSSMGVVIRDTDSPLTASSDLSQEDESSSLLGLNSSVQGMSDSGMGVSNVLQSSTLTSGSTFAQLPYVGTGPGGINGSSRKGSESSSSGTSGTGGCGDEVVHTVGFTRTGGIGTCSRSGKVGGSKRSKDQKTTRVRTVLNEKQLHTLRTCYAANPRPDALMKEQLVEMTSLSPRVIRVWFQNKRCKDKKRQILLKQMEQHQQNGNRQHTGLHGVPLVAGSPIRNDPNLMCTSSAIDIHQVPMAYWKSSTGSEVHMRAASQCTPFRTASPFGQPLKTKTPRSLSPNSSPLINVQESNAPILEPATPFSASLSSSLGTSLPAVSHGFSQNSVALSNSGNFVIEHGRFSTSNSRGGGNLLPIPLEFSEELHPLATSIPAFQQLVTTFDTTDASKLHFPATSSNPSMGISMRRTPDSLPALIYPPVLSNQIPPNMSLTIREEVGNTKFDNPFDSSQLSCGFPPPSSSEPHLYNNNSNNNSGNLNLSSSQATLSPKTSGINLLSFNQQPAGGGFLLPDTFPQNGMTQPNLPLSVRTQLST